MSADEDLWAEAERVLADPSVKKAGFDMKSQIKTLKSCDMYGKNVEERVLLVSSWHVCVSECGVFFWGGCE